MVLKEELVAKLKEVTRLERIKKIISGIIALKKKGEQKEMTEISCPICREKYSHAEFTVRCTGESKMWGIIQCTRCLHEMPFNMYHDRMQSLDIALPGAQSDRLNPSVPTDLVDDVQEAERANYSQCYKASVTMCRRAVQLGIMDKGIPDAPFQRMLDDALGQELISQDIYNLATSIKGYGDIGAHRREELDPEDVRMVIHAAVRMLNDMFK